MKSKLYKWSKHILCVAIAMSSWFPSKFASFLFFGEYPYPQKDD